mmetsp:Transcript_21762/g.39124  ORF Transcript_21762/g.39124 Transcript_21762/m.39124 type:complete len:560 (-) Transcript_21762:1666-3345(-)
MSEHSILLAPAGAVKPTMKTTQGPLLLVAAAVATAALCTVIPHVTTHSTTSLVSSTASPSVVYSNAHVQAPSTLTSVWAQHPPVPAANVQTNQPVWQQRANTAMARAWPVKGADTVAMAGATPTTDGLLWPMLLALPAALLGWVLGQRTSRQGTSPYALMAYTGQFEPPRHRRSRALWAEQYDKNEEYEERPAGNLAVAKPLLKPKTPTGELLQYHLKESPMLFEEAVQAQINVLAKEKESRAGLDVSDSSEVVLYKRIGEVKKQAAMRGVEDIMFYSIQYQFARIGVPPIQPHQLTRFPDFGPVNFEALTTGIHSTEALEVVRSHMRAVLGPIMDNPLMAMQSAVKISKFHTAQMYAASVLFGYFLRRADKRFQLAKMLGETPVIMSQEETISMLEGLLNRADNEESEESAPEDKPGRKMRLKDYIESFTPEQMNETARIVSVEAARLIQDYESALFGDLGELQQQFNDALTAEGPPMTPNELMDRMKSAVEEEKVDVLIMNFTDQRRIVLEAVAFGTFLRDAESTIDANSPYPLLTPSQLRGQPPPGLSLPGPEGPM